MIIVLKQNPNQAQYEHLQQWLKEMNLEVHVSEGKHSTILGLVGDTSIVDIDLVNAMDIVENVKRIQEPYKAANRKFHPFDTEVCVGEAKIGAGSFAMIAGPCSVETEEQIVGIAKEVRNTEQQCFAVVRSNPELLPMHFRDWAVTELNFSCLQRKRPDFPL